VQNHAASDAPSGLQFRQSFEPQTGFFACVFAVFVWLDDLVRLSDARCCSRAQI
jgi:hypothetical protein